MAAGENGGKAPPPCRGARVPGNRHGESRNEEKPRVKVPSGVEIAFGNAFLSLPDTKLKGQKNVTTPKDLLS